MLIVNLFLLVALQSPALKVVVGLNDGQQLVVENPEFSGFIEGRSIDAVLMYRQNKFHGEMPVKAISRIEFGPYRRGYPFLLTIALRNGQKIEVQSERRDFVTVKGRTDFGTVTIKHPDPIYSSLRLGMKRENRKQDLTIQYLEFPAS